VSICCAGSKPPWGLSEDPGVSGLWSQGKGGWGPCSGWLGPPTIGDMHTRTRAVSLRHYLILGVMVVAIVVAIVATLSAR